VKAVERGEQAGTNRAGAMLTCLLAHEHSREPLTPDSG